MHRRSLVWSVMAWALAPDPAGACTCMGPGGPELLGAPDVVRPPTAPILVRSRHRALRYALWNVETGAEVPLTVTRIVGEEIDRVAELVAPRPLAPGEYELVADRIGPASILGPANGRMRADFVADRLRVGTGGALPPPRWGGLTRLTSPHGPRARGSRPLSFRALEIGGMACGTGHPFLMVGVGWPEGALIHQRGNLFALWTSTASVPRFDVPPSAYAASYGGELWLGEPTYCDSADIHVPYRGTLHVGLKAVGVDGQLSEGTTFSVDLDQRLVAPPPWERRARPKPRKE